MSSNNSVLQSHSLGASIDKLRHLWGWFVAFGVLSAVLGFITLSYLVVSGTVVSVYMIGFFMIMAGAAEIAVGFSAKSWGWTMLWIFVGLLYIVAGVFTFAQPLLVASIFTVLIGALLVSTGIMRIVAAFQLPPGSRGMIIFAGAITLLLGVLILAEWPASGLFVLGTFLGVDLLFYGISWVAFGMRLRPHH